MATFEAVSAIVKETYRKLWNDWYAGCTPVRALVQVDLSDECSRYSHSHNLIIIAIAEGNLDDHDILDLSAWPIWKVELVHEMLHEWQAKTPCIATCGAEALCLKYAHSACGDGNSTKRWVDEWRSQEESWLRNPVSCCDDLQPVRVGPDRE